MNIKELAQKLAPHSMLAQVALESDAKSWGSSLVSYLQTKANELGLNDDANQKSIAVVDGEFIIKFPADEDLKVVLQRQVDGIRFSKAKNWHVKVSMLNAEAVKHFGEVNNFHFDHTASQAISDLIDQSRQNLKGSHVLTSSFALKPGFDITLRGYQNAAVEYALAVERALIADPCGVGKTFSALGLVHETDSLPALIICPASYKFGWRKEIQRALPHASILVCDSKSHIQHSLLWSTYDFYIVNYDLLSDRWDGEDKKNIILSDLALAFKERGLKAIVSDEGFYIKNPTAQRTIAACKLAEGVKYRLVLNGTPLDNRPKELIGQLMFLDRLKDFGSAWKFKKRFCGLTQKMIKGRLTWDDSGASDTKALGEILRSTCMIRRVKKDVLTELPDKQNVLLPVEIENRKTYDEAEYDVVAFVRQVALKDANYRQSLTGMTMTEQDAAMVAYANSKERKAMRAQALTKFNVLKKVASQGKMKHIQEWTENFLAGGEKLVIFAFFIETQEALKKLFPGCACVMGEMSSEKRFHQVERFQNDPECKVIVCSISAAAEAITLHASSDVLMVELPWSPGKKTQCEDRCHRDGQKNAVTVYDLIAERTIEEEILDMIEQKRKVGEAILDGTYDDDTNYVEEMMDRLLKKRGAK
jgi:SWI/SNF-related matrix-associated actin-dependent regulator of chromatin subfamily A-like protein 1